MQSFKLALGPVVRFFTRYLYIAIEQATSWGQWVVLGQEAWQELLKLVALNFDEMVQLVWRPLTWATVDVEPEVSVYSDAGERGWGGRLCLPSSEGFDGRGYLTPWQRDQSSTWREGMVVLQLLRSFESFLRPGLRI
jgi:hypothetical protein